MEEIVRNLPKAIELRHVLNLDIHSRVRIDSANSCRGNRRPWDRRERSEGGRAMSMTRDSRGEGASPWRTLKVSPGS